MPTNTVKEQCRNDPVGGTSSSRNQRSRRHTEAPRHVSNGWKRIRSRKENGVDSTLCLAGQHLGFVDVVRIVDLELATYEFERELLEFPLRPVENENSAINLHSVYIGRSDSNPEQAG
jgi:hypothetical protein